MAVAGLALVAVAAVACGDEDGTDAGSDPATTAVSPTPSMSESPSDTSSPSATADDPVPSPVINRAAKDAIRADFPALVPAGVPAGWTVTKATYSPKRGGQWWIHLEDTNGAEVTLAQSKKTVAGIVHQYLDGAKPSGEVDLSDYGTGKWSAYTGTMADAVAKALSGTSAVVVGPDQDTVLELAQQLLTAEDAGTGDGG
jgi:ABC-type amino acid transport substrate-binding protein